MGQTVFDRGKNERRQSWILGSPLFSSLFSSAPATRHIETRPVHRSLSLNEPIQCSESFRQNSLTMDSQPSKVPTVSSSLKQTQQEQQAQSRSLPKKPSALASILHKAKRHPKRSVTMDITSFSAPVNNSNSSNNKTNINMLCSSSSSSNHNNNSNSKTSKTSNNSKASSGSNNNNLNHKNNSTNTLKDEPDLHIPVKFLDSDEYEADKSQLKNDFMNLAFTEEFRSTVNFSKLKQGRILDVGCGSGAWCIDMAQRYPNIEVIGIDYEDWFPDFMPDNCRLIRGNILDILQTNFDIASFDFIHIRLMALIFTSQQYDLASRYCWRLLKPGATLEILEVDMKMCSAGPVTRKVNQEVMTVAEHQGFRTDVATKLADYVPKDDCLNLLQKYQSLPTGLWGGRLGVLFRDDLLDIFRRCQTAVCQHYARPKDDRLFNSDVNAACREMEQYHSYANFHFMTVNKRPTM